MAKSTTSPELRWAEDVIAVYEALPGDATVREKLSPQQRYMLRHIENSGEIDKFINGTVLKAMEMHAKYKSVDIDELVLNEEKRTIADLQRRLGDYLEEAMQGYEESDEITLEQILGEA